MLERKISLRSWPAALLLAVAVALPASAAEPTPATDSAVSWIQRMNVALTRRNFEGVLVHQMGKMREVSKIIHRVQGMRMSERRIVIPTEGSGPGSEFVRNGNESLEYYPRQNLVIVQERNRSYGFLRAFNGVKAASERNNYAITDHGAATIDGRVTQHVSIEPRDAVRYGYHFWLDADSALPLKTQILARSGEVLEEIWFETFWLPATIADERLKPEFDASKFKWKNRRMPAYSADLKKQFVPRAELLPAGFQVSFLSGPAGEAAARAKAPGPRARYLISDDIAVVSVFIEPAVQKPAPQDSAGGKGAAQAAGDSAGKGSAAAAVANPWVMGATTAYYTVVDDHLITVVGEVPPATAKAIAAALRPE
jgi:sigma-E factor negative regulatory protein RseB